MKYVLDTNTVSFLMRGDPDVSRRLGAQARTDVLLSQPALAEIHATKPVHMCFSFKVGNTPHKTAMRSMELMIGEVKPRVEKALGNKPAEPR